MNADFCAGERDGAHDASEHFPHHIMPHLERPYHAALLAEMGGYGEDYVGGYLWAYQDELDQMRLFHARATCSYIQKS